MGIKLSFNLEIYSFVTNPNAFRQCAISLRRIHSAPLKYFLKKLSELSIILNINLRVDYV